jgi:hypothetical protein
MRNLSSTVSWLSVGVFALCSSAAFAVTNVDTNAAWNGTTSISSFGVPNTATYGMTIQVPPLENSITSFSFQMGFATAAISFQPEIYAWDPVNNHATGPALWEGAPVSLPAGNGYTRFTFTPPTPIPVTGGGTYVIFVSTAKLQTAAPTAVSRFGALTNNTTYPGGQFVFINNGPDPTMWTSTTWNNIAVDLAFSVGFGGAPSVLDVPALSGRMTALLGLALALLGAFALRFRAA